MCKEGTHYIEIMDLACLFETSLVNQLSIEVTKRFSKCHFWRHVFTSKEMSIMLYSITSHCCLPYNCDFLKQTKFHCPSLFLWLYLVKMSKSGKKC